MPPSVGIPLDPLALAFDIPSVFSTQASFSIPHRASLTLVLEGDRRACLAGRYAFPRGFHCGASSILQGKEEHWRSISLPVGRAFLGERRCGTVPLWNPWHLVRRSNKTVRRHIY